MSRSGTGKDSESELLDGVDTTGDSRTAHSVKGSKKKNAFGSCSPSRKMGTSAWERGGVVTRMGNDLSDPSNHAVLFLGLITTPSVTKKSVPRIRSTFAISGRITASHSAVRPPISIGNCTYPRDSNSVPSAIITRGPRPVTEPGPKSSITSSG
eukprot:Trichotokara_eunicae@DN4020_c0_g1_i2.p2